MDFSRFDLKGKNALITGSSRGLGYEIAKGLYDHGAMVFINGRDKKRVLEAVNSISLEKNPNMIQPMAFDISVQSEVDRAFDEIKNNYNGIDILINNVGLRARRSLFEFTIDEVEKMIRHNILSSLDMAKHAARLMIDQKRGGRIINITSIAANIAQKGDPVYPFTKAALSSMTRTLAAELGQYRINVNSIAPGFFATETNSALVSNQDIAKMLEQRTSLGRWAKPSEIAGSAIFLASEAASYITGETITVDGGFLSHY